VKKFEPRPGFVVQAYKFALDPTPAQDAALRSHCGAARFAYNWAVRVVLANWAQRQAEESYGIAEQERTPWVSWSLPGLRKAWNQVKGQVAPWWAANSKEAYSAGLANAAAAFAGYTSSKNGKRAGARIGLPRVKSKRRTVPSCRFTTGVIRVEPDRKHVTLPRLGRIKTHESTRKLARKLEAGRARILSATIRYEAGRWFVALQVETVRVVRPLSRPGLVVGVDLGINHLAVLSVPVPSVSDEHGFVANPKHLKTALRKLRRLSRAVSRKSGPDRRTRQEPSKRWVKANRARKRVHWRVANLRRDGLHKLTTGLTNYAGVVVVEDLHVAGMLRNRRLARSIADARFGEIRRQLGYKTSWNGGQLIIADRWYPSSKICSGCGVVKAKLPLHTRTFTCGACGLVIDRDRNAAINLKQQVARSGRETLNGRGADRKTTPGVAGGCEALIPQGNRPLVTADCELSTH
jgi:putative transposase